MRRIRRIKQNHGVFTTSQRSNAVGKDDSFACNRALASGLQRFKRRAQRLGGNAVIGIVSNWKGAEFKSATQFQCAVGAIMSGVALKATVVTIEK